MEINIVKKDVVELEGKDTAIVIKEDGKLELHLAKPDNDGEENEGPAPDSSVLALKLMIALKSDSIMQKIDEEFDNAINLAQEDNDVEEFMKQKEADSNEGC